MMFNRPTVTLKASMENRTQIKCQNSSARISLNQVWYAIIENLEFSGCETDELILVNSVQNLSIIGCYFMNNDCPCGVLSISNTRKVVITNSSFVGNKAQNESIIYAVAVEASYNIMIVESSKFNNNNGNNGVLFIMGNGTKKQQLLVNNNRFEGNVGVFSGAIHCYLFNMTLKGNTFNENSGTESGAILSGQNWFKSSHNYYNNNVAHSAAIIAIKTSVFIISNDIINNSTIMISAKQQKTIAVINNTKITQNSGFIVLETRLNFTGDIEFNNNVAAMWFIKSAVDFHGNVTFTNNSKGVIKGTQSDMTFTPNSVVNFINNSNDLGGAISLDGGSLVSYGKLSFRGNSATKKGGAIYGFRCNIVFISQSLSDQFGNTSFINNSAKQGGAMYLIATGITITSHWLKIRDNKANEGGGIFLSLGSYIHLDKATGEYNDSLCYTKLEFDNNFAQSGGALYIVDDVACDGGSTSRNTELTNTILQCFLQTRAFYPYSRNDVNKIIFINVFFSNNTAIKSGGDIYGGLLDRCTPSPLADLKINPNFSSFNKITGLDLIENTAKFDWANEQHFTNTSIVSKHISSEAVQLCFCFNSEANCHYRNHNISVKKGQIFNLSVVAVNQVGQPVAATVVSSFQLNSGDQYLNGGEKNQKIKDQCNTLNYHVYSENASTMLQLYPAGPCANKGISKRNLTILFKPCTCPIGFEKTTSITNCECTCDKRLSPYVSACYFKDDKVQVEKQVWINYINATVNNSGFLIADCPFYYCRSSSTPFNLSFDNIDEQCTCNRGGILCGECEIGLSFVIGSSSCKKCSNITLFLVVPFALTGIALVAFILFFNLTVATGTINGLILYANILEANFSIFLPFQNYLTVILSWLNLDLGIETCFYNGMDSYGKVLLQLVFPLYLFTLIGIIIVLCNYSGPVGSLLGRRNPVAALCTFILLSYSKLIQTTITMLQRTTLDYPDGSKHLVWLYDGNNAYFKLTHIPLFIIAGFILILGIVYTALLFFAQWIHEYSHKKLFRWANNPRYHAFIDAMQAPFVPKKRYWFGLLLFTRIVHDVISAFSSEAITTLSVGIIAFGLILLKLINKSTYKKVLCDALETLFLTNLLILSLVVFYFQDSKSSKTTAVYVSICLTYSVFVFILGYHFCVFILRLQKMPGICLRIKERICSQRYYELVPPEEEYSSRSDSETDSARQDILIPPVHRI